jgi:hypothetical protein
VIRLNDKTGKTLVAAFTTILESGLLTVHLQTDKRTDFINRVFQKFLRENAVHFVTTQNEEAKASIVEPFNRTLKTKM